jgi:phosphoribosylformimino-5-aminoimidazole carboxamide ribotide isomerase
MPPFTILPAIDLKDGRCVRLRQGRAEEQTVYADDPVAVARDWRAQGATALHVVDLDGAFQGRPVHLPVIAKICAALDIPVELGGGLRTPEDLQAALDAGVDRVIIGTKALEGPAVLADWVRRFGHRLAVGIDARDGRVQAHGWVSTSDRLATDLACQVAEAGVRTLIYTDTARDGMLQGVNAPAMDEMAAAVPGVDIIASGGVTTAGDVRALRDLRRPNLNAVIVGKALYEGRVTLSELLTLTPTPSP